MKMTTGTGYGALTCEVSTSKTMSYSPREDVDELESDAIGYAACRFLRKSHALCRTYVKESYELRFAKGKARKTRRHCFVAPAPLMELPGAWVYVRISITASGVTVDHVGMYHSFAAAQEAAERYTIW